jgi:GntR family transcriptional regulator
MEDRRLFLGWQPRYAQLAETLATDIAAGLHKIGDLLPTEHALSDVHGVSRATVREALRRLEQFGMIERLQGIGTRIVSDKIGTKYVLTVQSAIEVMGYATSTRLVIHRREMIQADAALATALGVRRGSRWVHLSGIRLIADKSSQPISATDIYVAEAYAYLTKDV